MGKLNLRLIASVAVIAGIVGWTLVSKNYVTLEELLNKSSNSTGQACQVIYRTDANVQVGSSTIKAEAARSPKEQQKGLGGRDCIGRDQGMLFIFDKPGQYGFWMKDMEFPIDIIWIGQDKKIVHIEHDVSPSTYPQTFKNDKPAKYVLELKAGQAEKLEITTNSSIAF